MMDPESAKILYSLHIGLKGKHVYQEKSLTINLINKI
jgi:hypothetical protein